MMKILKPLLPLLTALMLTACDATNSDESFAIHTVLHAADGSLATTLPDGYILGKDVKQMTDHNGTSIFVMLPATIGPDCLQSMSAEESDHSGPIVNFSFTPECAKTFARMTSKNINKRIAAVVNGELVSTPLIYVPITGGSGFLEGPFESLEDAEAFARQFN